MNDVFHKDEKYLLDYIDIVDKTNEKWFYTQFKQQLPEKITEDFINELSLIQPPFESCSFEDIKKALEYTGSKSNYRIGFR